MIQLDHLKRANLCKTEQIGVKVTKEMKLKVLRECAKENVSMSGLVEALLEVWLKSRENSSSQP